MCRTDTTLRITLRLIAGLAVCCGLGLAQAPASPAIRSAAIWRKLGNDSVAMSLAGPAGGPVAAVWYSDQGDRLFVRTRSGQILESSDFSTWTAIVTPSSPQPADRPIFENIRLPEPAARLQWVGSRLYSLGSNLQVSEDAGQTWTNLTAFHRESVIGSGQHSVAVSPQDSRQIVVANDFGVWKSTDAGLSWSGLNEDLPNLPI